MQYPSRGQSRYAARPRLLATGPPGLDSGIHHGSMANRAPRAWAPDFTADPTANSNEHDSLSALRVSTSTLGKTVTWTNTHKDQVQV